MTVYLLIGYSLLLLITGCSPRPSLYKETRLLMGTIVEVTMEGERDESAKICQRLFQRLEKIEARFSLYNPQSEINEVNSKAGRDVVRVSDEFFNLLEKSLVWSELTSGAFDISVAPLVKLWGFKEHKPAVPGEEEIKRALENCGYTYIRLSPKNQEVSFLKPGLEIDMGGVAKGYIVGEGIRFLRKEGVRAALLNAGGDLYGLGSPLGQEGWSIGLQHPRKKGKIFTKLVICDKAVATSGDYENFFLYEGKYLSHIIDPKTGRPSLSGVISATVISADSAEADALATALVVMGKDKGLDLVNHLSGVEAIIIFLEQGKLKAAASSGLEGKCLSL